MVLPEQLPLTFIDQTSTAVLKDLLRERNPLFWQHLVKRSEKPGDFRDLLLLSTLRRRATALSLEDSRVKADIRVAMVGGYSLFPLQELVEHFLVVSGFNPTLFIGSYDNYVSEMTDPGSDLHAFAPQVVIVIPANRRSKYLGRISDPPSLAREQALADASQLLAICTELHERTRAEILLANFLPPAGFDPGPYRVRTAGSDWTFRKLVNLELGLNAPPCVHICDLEFLAFRRGGLAVFDDRAWFESKQPCSADFLVDIAQEITSVVKSLKSGPKKVLVVDLDNTLWGGVIGDDGIEGIELGDTSPRGEAFKSFQKYILSLHDRGVLLAVCSKNDYERAIEPFHDHPEMVLRLEHFVSFKANWEPKSDNIRAIAADLGLGLDSVVFVDDNPAEIDLVRQLAEEVTAIHLGPDPATFVRRLEDSRLFEPHSITEDDARRTDQYRQEGARAALTASATDITACLAAFNMTAEIRPFRRVDVPRIAQLINKSNQFNLTTRRRTEAEVSALIGDPDIVAFSIRLADHYGDYGLIAVVIARIAAAGVLDIDTWLMSCRVLKRQVEEFTMNELVRLAAARSCHQIHGIYLPTAKNSMVRDLYPQLGFQLASAAEAKVDYVLDVASYQPRSTMISITEPL